MQLWNTDTWELKTTIGFKPGSWVAEPLLVPGKPLVIVRESSLMTEILILPSLLIGQFPRIDPWVPYRFSLIDGNTGRRHSVTLNLG